MARPYIEDGPFGSKEAEPTPEFRSDRQAAKRYIGNLANTSDRLIREAQEALDVGKPEIAKIHSAAAKFQNYRAEAATHVLGSTDSQAQQLFIAELLGESERLNQAAQSADSPKKANDRTASSELLRAMAEAGAYVLDCIDPLPSTYQWIEGLETLTDYTMTPQPPAGDTLAGVPAGV